MSKRTNQCDKSPSKDELLHTVFARNAAYNIGGRGVCQIRQENTLYEVCGACVLMRPCPPEYQTKRELTPFNADYDKLPCFSPNSVEALLPENAIVPWRIDLTSKQFASLLDASMYVLPMCLSSASIEPGLLVLEHDILDKANFFVRESLPLSKSSGNTDWAKYLKQSFYCLPRFMQELEIDLRAFLANVRANLTMSTSGKVLTLVLVGDSAMLYLAMARVMKRAFGDSPKLTYKNEAWTLSGWEDATQSYAEVRKGGIMKEPNLQPPPSTMRKSAFAAAKPEEHDTPNSPASSAPEQPETKTTVWQTGYGPVVVEKAQETRAQPAEQKEETPVEEPEKTAEATEKRRTRTRKAPTEVKQCNLDAITEALGAPVQDLSPNQLEAAVEEIRGIRDLQIAATRRMANLALAIHKTTGASSAVLEEVRTLLAGK